MNVERYTSDQGLIVEIKTQDKTLYFPKCLMKNNTELIKMLDRHDRANELDLSDFDTLTVTQFLYYLEMNEIKCESLDELKKFCELADYALLTFNYRILEEYFNKLSLDLYRILCYSKSYQININDDIDKILDKNKPLRFIEYNKLTFSWLDIIRILNLPFSLLDKLSIIYREVLEVNRLVNILGERSIRCNLCIISAEEREKESRLILAEREILHDRLHEFNKYL